MFWKNTLVQSNYRKDKKTLRVTNLHIKITRIAITMRVSGYLQTPRYSIFNNT